MQGRNLQANREYQPIFDLQSPKAQHDLNQSYQTAFCKQIQNLDFKIGTGQPPPKAITEFPAAQRCHSSAKPP
jgi:hypothetical protein